MRMAKTADKHLHFRPPLRVTARSSARMADYGPLTTYCTECAGIRLRDCLIQDRSHPVDLTGELPEPPKAAPKRTHRMNLVLQFPVDELGLYPVAKPVGLLEFLSETYTRPIEIVFNSAMGIGSTGIAAAACVHYRQASAKNIRIISGGKRPLCMRSVNNVSHYQHVPFVLPNYFKYDSLDLSK